MKHYNAIIIGSGQGGTPLAIRLAKAGYQTALIEKKWIGGTCINNGCIPSKTLIASAKAAYAASTAGEVGIDNTDNYQVDFSKVMQRKNSISERFRKGSENSLKETEGLDIIYGTASFTEKNKITIIDGKNAGQYHTADLIFINTGAQPHIPPIKGLQQIPYLSSTTLMEISELPEHLLIIGAGYISMELGQAFRRFGSKVTIIETEPILLSKEDEDIREELLKILEEEHITLLPGTKVEELSLSNRKEIIAHIVKDGTKAVITGSHLLIATGRVPATKELHLELAGIETDEDGFIKVNDQLETNQEGIYALGDVKGGPAFTHVSYNDYRIILNNLLGHQKRSTQGRLVPYCMFTDPELGRIGITEAEAIAQGIPIEVARLYMDKVSRGIIENKTKGLLKAVVHKDSGKILGASLLCANGGEIMSVLQMAMEAGFTYRDLQEQIFAHPTLSESLNNLFFTLDH